MESGNLDQELSPAFLVLVAVLVLAGLLFFELLGDQFLLSSDREAGKVVCLCCDLWPMKYLRFLKKKHA